MTIEGRRAVVAARVRLVEAPGQRIEVRSKGSDLVAIDRWFYYGLLVLVALDFLIWAVRLVSDVI